MVVMADGYRAGNDISKFEEYAKDAFEDASTFHYTKNRNTHDHITNRFFERFWYDINVVMVKTVSNSSGINTVAGYREKDTILQVNSDISGAKNDFKAGNSNNIQKVINRNFEKIGLAPKNIDVIIIFVNQAIRSYTIINENNMGERNYQPINRVVIGAPTGYSRYSANFHDTVRTSSITHELGHALAHLDDEYIEAGKNPGYSPALRNIDLVANRNNPKWRGLPSVYFTSNIPSVDTDHRVGNFVGAFYDPIEYIRPTYKSTMAADLASTDYQFGPVNTYHLTGSFKTRMGEIVEQDPGYALWEKNNYEWKGYSFNDFTWEWSINDFYY